MQRHLFFALAALTLIGCRPPHAIVVVEDPGGFGAGADNIALGTDREALVATSLEGLTFPVRLTLTSKVADDQEIWLEARAGTRVLARGRADAQFDDDRTRTFELQLRAPCGVGEQVICDDEVFCNGVERCIDTMCVPSGPPCPPSEHDCVFSRCDEERGACDLFPSADACGPVLVDDVQLPGFCDIKAGCVAGQPCTTDTECNNGFFCDGDEACVDQRCVAGVPPSVASSNNPCIVAGCSEAAQDILEEAVVDGTACSTDGDTILDGVCIVGECISTTCGDGVVDAISGERCDDGNRNNLDLCDNTCQPVVFLSEVFLGGGMCDGAPLDVAALGMPQGIAVGPDGSIWLADPDHDVVRRILPDNTIVRVAGTGTPRTTFSSDPRAVSLHDPTSVAVLSDGTAFFNDRRDPGFLRRVSPSGVLESYGRVIKGGAIETALASSYLDAPDHLSLSADETVLYMVRDAKILEIPLTGASAAVDHIAGSSSGSNLAGPADAVDLGVITDVVQRPDGSVLSTHTSSGVTNHAVVELKRQADGTWRASRVAGDGGCNGMGEDVDPTSTSFCNPREIVQGAFGDDYCVVIGRAVHCVDNGVVLRRVGTGSDGRPVEGELPLDINLGDIRGLAVEPGGSLLILGESFPGAHLIRVPANLGPIEVLKDSTAPRRRCGEGLPGERSGIGRVASLGFAPSGGLQAFSEEEFFHLDDAGLMVHAGHMKGQRFGRADNGTYFGVDGSIVCVQEDIGLGAEHVAGGGISPDDDPLDANNIELRGPVEIEAINEDEFLLLEREGQRLRRISRFPGTTLDPWVSITVAGTGAPDPVSVDGPATSTGLFWPIDFAIAPGGSIYIAESEGGRLRRLTATGTDLQTIATFDAGLRSVAVDPEGNVYVADENGRVFLLPAGDGFVTPGATPIHIAGTGAPGVGTGAAIKAALSAPQDLIVDDNGEVYLALRDELTVIRLSRVRP